VTDRRLYDPVRGSSEPDRFWTTTNVAEATPDLLSPLCWDIWGDRLEGGWRRSMYDFGLLARCETTVNADPNTRSTAAIYGRQVVNVGVIRQVMGRMPGVEPDDVERDLLGSVRPGIPSERGAGMRLPIIAAKLPRVIFRTGALVRQLNERNRTWWRTEVAPGNSTDPLRRLQVSADMFGEAFPLHSRVRFLVPAAERLVTVLMRQSGFDDLAALSGGFGNVAETALADDLWRVSRGELSIDDFLGEYGFHGPNEGNVFTRSWREQPERVAALVDSFRSREDLTRPRDLECAAIQARQDTLATVLAGTPRLLQPVLKASLGWLGSLTRSLELTKASYLRSFDGARAAARALGRDLVAQGVMRDVDDAFFLTIEEHRRVARGEFADQQRFVQELVDYRRGERARYARFQMPITFTGMPDLDSPSEAGRLEDTAELAGAAGGCGTVEGRARVVLDPNEDVDLDPGDILVCRYTDPSWAPLFVCAAALVIDIGTAVSHGAVVAREMGIPYVIGTSTGTTVIRDGDRIRVEGAARRVLILTRHTEAQRQ
jgi:pyruvate,water dikinase